MIGWENARTTGTGKLNDFKAGFDNLNHLLKTIILEWRMLEIENNFCRR